MRYFLILFAAVMVFTSCRNKDLIRPGDTIDVAFDKAKSLYDQEKYGDASQAFEVVVSIGRGTDVGQEAQFLLAESYFNNRRFLMAAAEYERYTLMHPNSPRRQKADYKKALSYYNMSPRYKLEQSNTRKALESFNLYLSLYPDSDRVQEVSDKVSELRNKLARKQFEAAQFYKRTNRYRAAAVYFDSILEEFPGSVWAERATVEQIESYIMYAENSISSRQEERYQTAVDVYGTYIQLFPRGENRSRAEDLYDRAQRELDKLRDGQSVAQSDG